MSRGAHRRRSHHRVLVLLFGFLLVALVVVVRADPASQPSGKPPAADVTHAPTTESADRISPYTGVGTWLSRYRITREFGGAVSPCHQLVAHHPGGRH
jgi:hypothetical protein